MSDIYSGPNFRQTGNNPDRRPPDNRPIKRPLPLFALHSETEKELRAEGWPLPFASSTEAIFVQKVIEQAGVSLDDPYVPVELDD